MSQSIGQKLAAARKRRDLTIEDVAHETRIHTDTLRHLEADDYSHFANFTYAKSFLSMYGRHLGLDMTDYLKEFRAADTGNSHASDPVEAPANGPAGNDVFAPVKDLQRYRPVAAILIFFAIVCTIPGMYFLGRTHGVKAANQIASKSAREAALQSQDGKAPPSATSFPGSTPPSNTAALVTPPSPPVPDPDPVPATPPSPPPSPIAEKAVPPPSTTPIAPPGVPAEPSGSVEVVRPALVIDPSSEVKKAVPIQPENQPENQSANQPNN